MIYMAIDPGSVSGAYAVLGPDQEATCDDLPVVDKMVDAAAWARIVKSHNPTVAIVEDVAAMPKQGARSGFRFGMGVGIIRGVLGGLEVPVVLVHATRWKKHFRLDSDKEKSRALAIRMFPRVPNLTRVKDHGRAEALLIASYYRSITE